MIRFIFSLKKERKGLTSSIHILNTQWILRIKYVVIVKSLRIGMLK